MIAILFKLIIHWICLERMNLTKIFESISLIQMKVYFLKRFFPIAIRIYLKSKAPGLWCQMIICPRMATADCFGSTQVLFLFLSLIIAWRLLDEQLKEIVMTERRNIQFIYNLKDNATSIFWVMVISILEAIVKISYYLLLLFLLRFWYQHFIEFTGLLLHETSVCESFISINFKW